IATTFGGGRMSHSAFRQRDSDLEQCFTRFATDWHWLPMVKRPISQDCDSNGRPPRDASIVVRVKSDQLASVGSTEATSDDSASVWSDRTRAPSCRPMRTARGLRHSRSVLTCRILHSPGTAGSSGPPLLYAASNTKANANRITPPTHPPSTTRPGAIQPIANPAETSAAASPANVLIPYRKPNASQSPPTM